MSSQKFTNIVAVLGVILAIVGIIVAIVNKEVRCGLKLDSCPSWEIKGTIPLKGVSASAKELTDYTKLDQLLQAGEFDSADQETYQIMLQVVGKKENGWLKAPNIENFPCKDLRTIDNLWLQHSEKKYGLSTQYQIWQDVGGSSNANQDEIYSRFAERVGWNIENSKDVDKLFSESLEKQGNLPRWGGKQLLEKAGTVYNQERQALCVLSYDNCTPKPIFSRLKICLENPSMWE